MGKSSNRDILFRSSSQLSVGEASSQLHPDHEDRLKKLRDFYASADRLLRAHKLSANSGCDAADELLRKINLDPPEFDNG